MLAGAPQLGAYFRSNRAGLLQALAVLAIHARQRRHQLRWTGARGGDGRHRHCRERRALALAAANTCLQLSEANHRACRCPLYSTHSRGVVPFGE